MNRVAIIGGGLAGLVNAVRLSRSGFQVKLFEKKQYPFHKVCGEYLSNEVLDFLQRENLLPPKNDLPQISRFEFSAINGKNLTMPLTLGGFGLSRYILDNFLAEQARIAGAKIIENTTIIDVTYANNSFTVESATNETFTADIVIGAYGKNGAIDKKLNREYLKHEAPFIGVKYHIKADLPRDLVALHNFEGGYCGVSAIENEQFNLCYLGLRETLKKSGSIEQMEVDVLSQNPHLNSIFKNAEFVFDKPTVINAFSFRPKHLIENHILMSGDTAGLITPLCGNGMAMAIHSAKILSDSIIEFTENGQLQRDKLEKAYTQKWNQTFKKRLWVGRKTQNLFGAKWSSGLALGLMKNSPWLAKKIMHNTHGQPF